MNVVVVVELPAQGETVIPLRRWPDHVLADSRISQFPDCLCLRIIRIIGKLDIAAQILVFVSEPLIILAIIGTISDIVLEVDLEVGPIWRWDPLLEIEFLKVLLFPQPQLDAELLEIDVTDGTQVDHSLLDFGDF